MKKAAIYLLLGLFALLVLHPGLNSSYTAPDVRVPTVNNSGSTTNEDATMTSSQSHAVIAVDAGHGGSDYGYVSDTTIPEKDINLDLALAIGRKLSAAGYQVVYTRESDDVPVFDTEAAASQDRLRRMKEQGVQYLVSDHYANFPILMDRDVPSILLELGYVTNPDDYAKLTDSSYQDRIGEAVAEAFLKVVN